MDELLSDETELCSEIMTGYSWDIIFLYRVDGRVMAPTRGNQTEELIRNFAQTPQSREGLLVLSFFVFPKLLGRSWRYKMLEQHKEPVLFTEKELEKKSKTLEKPFHGHGRGLKPSHLLAVLHKCN
ncbi:uncharacterized protein RHO17_013542 [Thomomys bottae]